MNRSFTPTVAFASMLLTAAASAQTWTGANGQSWGDPGNWTGGVPNSSGAIVSILSPVDNPVILGGNFTVGTLTMGLGTSLDFGSNNLDIAGGSFSNLGSVSIVDGILQVESGNLTLTGNGTISLTNNGWINQASGGLSLINDGNTIQGSGQLGQNGLSLNNEAGLVTANLAGQTLFLNGGGSVTNAATLAASNSGTLQISNNVANAGGLIKADGGTVNLSAAVTGGTLTTVNSGVIQANGTATLNGVTISSGSTYTDADTTLIQGTITNNGTIAVPNGTLQVNGGDVTLQGGGTVTMSSDAFFNQSSSGLNLNNVNNTIQGTGQLGQNGLALNNESGGTVNANDSSGTLTMNGSGTVTNAGLLEATSSGTLQINNTVNNTGVIKANGGTVDINAAINGGTLTTVGTGAMNNDGTTTLNGVTISTGSTFNVGGGTTLLQGTIVNKGTISVPNGTLQVNGGDVTLQGGGTVAMTGDAFFNQTTGGLNLHNFNNTIQGSGQLGENGLAVDNQAAGVVDANISGATLTLGGGGTVTNNGLLEATAGGILSIANTVNNFTNLTANGGTVDINSTINGGTLNTTGGGTMANIGSTVLNGVTLSAGSTFNVGAGTTFLEGTFTNKGEVDDPNGTLQIMNGDVTLTGGGTVSMTADAFINQSSSGLTLHNVNNLIEGSGQIGENGLALDNQSAGTIDANISGATLDLNGGIGVTNAGLIEATNGGILSITNNVNNSSTIIANGGTVNINSQINGGTLTTTGGGTMNNGGSTVLNGVTLSTGTTFNVGGGTTFLEGTITNNGVFAVPDGNLTLLGGDVTLTGGGTEMLTQDAFINQNSGGLTLHNIDNLIEGSGQVGQNGLAIDNHAAGTIDANITSVALNLNGGGLVTNAGLIEATNGGILNISSNVNNSANITANGGTINLNSTITGGTLNSVGGGTINNTGSTILNNVTLSTGSTFNVGGGTTFLENTLTNQGTFTLPDGNLTVLGGNLTLNGGGTVVMQQNAFFNQNSGGLVLHNVDNTIEGTGQLGQNGLSIDNESGGTILANVSGGTLNINGSGSLTNAGTIHTTFGATLIATMTLNQTGGLTLVDSGSLLNAPAVNIMGGTLEVNGTLDPMAIEIFHADPSQGIAGGFLDGVGSVVGDVTNDGTTLMGDSAGDSGMLTIEGDFTQNADGILADGLDSATHDGLLDVTGVFTLNGTLDIDLEHFNPTHGEVFELATGYSSEAIGSVTFDPNSGLASYWSLAVNDLGSDQVDLVYMGPSVVQQGVPDSSNVWLDTAIIAALALGAPLIRRKLVSVAF